MDPKLPWGVNQTQPGSMKTISDSKLQIFAVGQQKKTRFQKSREEKEQKVKEEDAAAAKIFDSFVASFTVEEGNAKTFVRGGEGKAGEAYKLDSKKSSSSSSSSGSSSEMDSIMQEIMSKDEKKFSTSSVSSSSSSSSSSGGNKKERQIDDFLSEIKAKQESKASGNSNNDGYRSNRDRDSSGNTSNNSGTFDPLGILSPAASGSILQVKGSFDDGDPHTTNIYVGNLAPTVTEEHLHELFGRYGDINSVKVMWPRTDEEKARKRNCGFVSFMRRSDAEDAKIDLQDYVLEGNKMAVSWGKAVKINSCPFILPPPKVPLPAVSRPQQQPTLPSPSLPQQQPTPSTSLSSPSFIPSPVPMTTIANLSSQPPPPQFLPPPSFAPPSFLSTHLPPPPPSTLSGNDNSIAESKDNEDSASTLSVAPSSSLSSFPIPAAIVPPPSYPHSASTATASMPIVSRSKWDTPPFPLTPSNTATLSATATVTTAQSTAATLEMNENDTRIQIIPPVDKKVKELIDLTAKFVGADGNVFEKSIKLREESNPDFAFLYDLTTSDHQYYRWRVFANIMGDSERKWYAKPFKYNVHGIFIIPPEPPVTAVRESTESGSGGKSCSRRRRSSSESRSVSRGRDQGRGSNRSKCSDDDEEGDRDSHRRSRRRSQSHSHSSNRNNHSDHRRHHRNSCSRSRSTDRKSSSTSGTSNPHREDGRSDYRRERDNKDSKAISDRVKYAGMTGAQIERARAKERSSKTTLSSLTDEEYYEWKSILGSLTLQKQDIKYAMGFAYDKIDDDNNNDKDGHNSRNGPAIVSEICYLLKKSLCNITTPPAIKIARLYLLSDILHNSAAPIKYASNFRVEIQNLLPQIFEDQLGAMRRNSTLMGRMTAYQVDERIKRLLGAWEEWSLLSYTFIMGLESAFYQSEHDYNIYQACVESSQPSKSDSSTSGNKIKEENQKTNDAIAAAEDEKDYDEEDEDRSKDFEHYKRQAKLSGVYISPKDTGKSLKLKLQQYQNYQTNKYKLNSTTIAPTAQQMAARILGHSMMTGGSGMSHTEAGGVVGGSESEMEYNIEDDDIDGAPISQHTLHHLPLLSALNTQQNFIDNKKDINNTNINDYEDDEEADIDGVPLDFADHLASLSAAHDHDTTNSNTYNRNINSHYTNQYSDNNNEVDDVDGAPMQEDSDDIDGIPL